MEGKLNAHTGPSRTLGIAIGKHSSPFFSLSLPLPLPLSSHIHLPWNSFIDRARGTRASAVCHDDPRGRNRPCRRFPRRDHRCCNNGQHPQVHLVAPEWLLHAWGGQGELAFWWVETKDCHRMYFFLFPFFFSSW